MSSWGVTRQERLLRFPCDQYELGHGAVFYRGITIQAPPEVIFRWLCQLRVAPYSYDWIDNQGRQSPRVMTPGVEKLELGQRMMGFELIDFEPNQFLTLQGKATIYGDGIGTYLILPETRDTCRLLVKLRIKYPRGPFGTILRRLLPWGDMIMMRRQLLNLKRLSEETRGTTFNPNCKEVVL